MARGEIIEYGADKIFALSIPTLGKITPLSDLLSIQSSEWTEVETFSSHKRHRIGVLLSYSVPGSKIEFIEDQKFCQAVSHRR